MQFVEGLLETAANLEIYFGKPSTWKYCIRNIASICADGTASCSRRDLLETIGLGSTSETAGGQHTSEPDVETVVVGSITGQSE